MSHDNCLFCKIATKVIPATFLLEDEHACAFRDLNPMAPTHVLVIPKKHHVNIDDAADDALAVSCVMRMARDVARAEGLKDSGYRLVMNSGSDAGQSVFHWHVHVLGGRQLGWPPG